MAIKYCDEFEPVLTNSILDDIGRIPDDEFSCAEDSARPSDLWLGLEELDRFEDARCDECCVLLRMFRDVFSESREVLDRPA